MIHGKESNLIVIKLDDGEVLHTGLERALTENMVRSGAVLGGVGMVTDFKIGYFDGKEYVAREINEPHELLSLQGNIAHAGGGQLMLHLHCTVGDKQHNVSGGHLISAKVKHMNEIFVLRLMDLELGRRRNERTGLMEMEIKKTSEFRFTHSAAKQRSGSLELDSD
jgi:predicted DNA-binding protein with PD1-like motif